LLVDIYYKQTKQIKKGSVVIKTFLKIPKEFRKTVFNKGMKVDVETNELYVPKELFISTFNQFIPLTIELIPGSNWENNVRSEYGNDWEWIKRISYKKANYRCEICNGVGNKHPVECHEVWDFDIDNKIQKLTGLVSLCPTCHKVKHIGLAFVKGEENIAIQQLKVVNGWTDKDVYKYIEESFLIYEALSRIQWNLDLSFLDEILINKVQE